MDALLLAEARVIGRRPVVALAQRLGVKAPPLAVTTDEHHIVIRDGIERVQRDIAVRLGPALQQTVRAFAAFAEAVES